VRLAIVGRPNVGKSTLFNRLAGRKLAIVDDRPGVTRDRRFGTGRLGDLDLDLIDTAGFEDVTDESLEARMRGQTELAVAQAEVVLFVIDAREGVVPLDELFAAVLRKSGKPVILVANKTEGRAGDAGALEAWNLGFGEPVSISAEHGEGMSDLFVAVLAGARSADDVDEDDAFGDAPPDKPIRLAIVGRPNAGKSTLINRLIGEERLLTGPEAGITRDAVSVDWTYDGRRVRLVDTAGLRRKARIEEKLEKLSTQDTIRAITFAEVVVLVMDATHPFETQDLQIADLVEREGRALIFVLAKWDLVEDPGARLKAFIERAEEMLPQLRGAPVVALSAETGRGLDRAQRLPGAAGTPAARHFRRRASSRARRPRHPPRCRCGRNRLGHIRIGPGAGLSQFRREFALDGDGPTRMWEDDDAGHHHVRDRAALRAGRQQRTAHVATLGPSVAGRPAPSAADRAGLGLCGEIRLQPRRGERDDDRLGRRPGQPRTSARPIGGGVAVTVVVERPGDLPHR